LASHVSVRLYWHDNAWDGSICRDPKRNTWCEMHEHVKENKDVEAEFKSRGLSIAESAVCPGCEVSSQAFARRPNEILVAPPDWMRPRVKPVTFDMDELSAGMWPYEDMWTEDGTHKSDEERREIVERFLTEIEPGKSLVFFYVDERNPLFADDGYHSPHRALVGISRITHVGDIREYEQPVYSGIHHMVWSVPFKHAFPLDGIRLPVHAVRNSIKSPDERRDYLVALDGGIRKDFRYGSSRISLDRCLVSIERAISALRRFKDDARFTQSVDSELGWLNERLLELWHDRGPYPGMAAVLGSLGCRRAMEIQLNAVPQLINDGRDPAEVIVASLEGEADPLLAAFEDELFDAGDEWSYLDDDEKHFATLLMRMELLPDQVGHLLSPDSRKLHRLPTDAAELLANPYLLAEAYVPSRGGDPIAFVTVDHGLLPHDAMPLGRDDRVGRNDPRRARALMVDALRERAEEGHTFDTASAVLDAMRQRSPEDRVCDISAERMAHEKVAPVLAEAVEHFEVEEGAFLALRELRDREALLQAVFDELASRPALDLPAIDWGDHADAKLDLSDEQERALDRTYRGALSVLTGAAGTGKSTLLAPLIAGIRSKEGQIPISVLTPTGKAADRLKELDVSAMTIHSALASADWFDWDLYVSKPDGGSPITADTIIIDESSMVSVELLSTLFRAIDWNGVKRLILVGDHNQLPPIGPGRPFYDLIARMTVAGAAAQPDPYAGRLSKLTHNYRVAEGSRAIAFATGFAGEPEADEPQIWSALARGEDQGDLRIRFWNDTDELYEQLFAEIERVVREETSADDLRDWKAFDATIGHPDVAKGALWQILSPMRGHAHGTSKINTLVQDRFHGWAKRGNADRHAVKMGDQAITSFDKVIQISNERMRGVGRDEDEWQAVQVFNGQIGTVRSCFPSAFREPGRERPKGLMVAFTGNPSVNVRYTQGDVGRLLELAYAITVHKSQGSQFGRVFFVVPQAALASFGRELTYTGLTRCEESLTLFVERDIGPLLALRKHAAAKTPLRNSRLFGVSLGASHGYRPGGLVHLTSRGDYVRSKSEVIVANVLDEYERQGRLSYAYEEELYAPTEEKHDLRLPDFTVHINGRTFYWEHCGMAHDPAYLARWQEVRLPWYIRNGFKDQLIVTEDGVGGTIDTPAIREIVEKQILS
jgi:exodeoxyribonuclease V alpha subunit